MKTATPKFEKIKRSIIRDIEAGVFESGSLFLSESQLCTRFNVSRPTIVRSLHELAGEGYLYRVQGKGTFVSSRWNDAKGNNVSDRVVVFLSEDVANLVGAAREVQMRILRGIQRASGNTSMMPNICQCSRTGIDSGVENIIKSNAAGIALLIEPSFNCELKERLTDAGWAVWGINEPLIDAHCVFIDQQYAGYIATKYLLERGRKKVALFNGPVRDFWGFQARYDGYKQALREMEVSFDESLVFEASHPVDSEAGRIMMNRLIVGGLAADGVVCVSDIKAFGAMQVAKENNIDIPERLAFVSIDNTIAEQANPPLPSVAMPFEDMGFQAAVQAKLAEQHKNLHQSAFTRIKLQPRLVLR